jgi:hypothetical protein
MGLPSPSREKAKVTATILGFPRDERPRGLRQVLWRHTLTQYKAAGAAPLHTTPGDGPPVTTLTGTVADQAALQGLLRRLYSLGLPLISAHCIECGSEE